MTNDEQKLFDEIADRLDLYRLRTAELEAALEAKHQQYTGAVIQLAEARKDGERLEWLFDILSLTDNDGDAKALSLANQVMRKCAGLVDTPRAAIDAARGAK